jgi:hypothetical protein
LIQDRFARVLNMTSIDPLTGIRSKIERAQKHVIDLNAAIFGFGSTRPYEITANKDDESGKVVYRLSGIKSTPNDILLIAGDAIHALRSALDHLAYRIWSTNGGTGNPKHVYFPIADSREDFVSKVSGPKTQIRGVSPAIWTAIEAVEAYNGGNGHDLWVIHALDNVDKHRTLMAAASVHRNVDVGDLMARQIVADMEARTGETFNLALSLPLVPLETKFPAEAGDALFETNGIEVDQNIKFAFQVAFNEPGIVQGEPILSTMPKLVNSVDSVFAQLAKFVRHSSPPSRE